MQSLENLSPAEATEVISHTVPAHGQKEKGALRQCCDNGVAEVKILAPKQSPTRGLSAAHSLSLSCTNTHTASFSHKCLFNATVRAETPPCCFSINNISRFHVANVLGFLFFVIVYEITKQACWELHSNTRRIILHMEKAL